jgi:hypothetical protein
LLQTLFKSFYFFSSGSIGIAFPERHGSAAAGWQNALRVNTRILLSGNVLQEPNALIAEQTAQDVKRSRLVK